MSTKARANLFRHSAKAFLSIYVFVTGTLKSTTIDIMDFNDIMNGYENIERRLQNSDLKFFKSSTPTTHLHSHG